MSAVTQVTALMLRFRFVLVIAVILSLAGCKREPFSRSNSGFSALDKSVLYDFRADRHPGSSADAATTHKVLSAVFPAYLSDASQCRPGGIAPRIRGAAEGSFTAAGLNQTVYLIDTGECGRAASATTKRLVVFSGNKLEANVETSIGTAILGAYDLDRDRKSELLLEGGGRGPGEWIKVAQLVQFQKDKLQMVEDLGQVRDDPCATTLAKRSLTARVVYYLPPPAGQKVRFTVEVYVAPCPVDGQQPHWTRAVAR